MMFRGYQLTTFTD